MAFNLSARRLSSSTPSDGFTLLEVLVSTFLSTLLLLALFGLLGALRQGEVAFWRQIRWSAGLRSAHHRLEKGICQAGLGAEAADPPFPPFGSSGETSIVVHRDFDGDGLLSGSGEQTRYWLDDGTLREENRPIAEGITDLRFSYHILSGVDGLPDGVDNNGDGLVDERGEMRPSGTPADYTADGIDNDGDGLIDESDESDLHHIALVHVEIEVSEDSGIGGGESVRSREIHLKCHPRGGRDRHR